MADLIFDNVTKQFGQRPVLDGFSYTFRDGERYCLMGPSGCGKTTLLRLASGLLQPDGGILSGSDQRFSYVFQEDRLLPWYSARKNIRLTCRRFTPDFWLEAMGLSDFADALPAALSGGMRRRVAIARALAADGDGYLFDEPFAGLDPDLRKQVIACILNYTKDKLCLFTTHDMADARAISPHIIGFSGPPLKIL